MHEFYYYAASMSIHVAHDLMVKHPSIETGFFFPLKGVGADGRLGMFKHSPYAKVYKKLRCVTYNLISYTFTKI